MGFGPDRLVSKRGLTIVGHFKGRGGGMEGIGRDADQRGKNEVSILGSLEKNEDD